jgi:glutamyl-tRNA synthetase
VSRGAARFDEAELQALSARTLHALPFETVRERLAHYEITGTKAEPFWLAVRGNLTRMEEVLDWWRVVEGEIEPVIEDADYCRAALALLPDEIFDEKSWSRWTTAVKDMTGRKGRALFHPLRLALTGRDQGPELAQLLPLIGRVKAVGRLSAPGA